MLVAEWDGKWRRPPHSEAVQGVRIAYLMPALSQARKSSLSRFLSLLNGPFKFLGGRFNGLESCCRFPGGSTIQFVSQEQREATRGMRTDAVLVDEADDIEMGTFGGIVMPWLSEPHSLNLVLMGGTPRRGRHGLLYDGFRNGVESFQGWRSFRATWQDFPEHVSSEFALSERARLERAGQLAVFKREWEIDFDAGEGLVFPHFTPDVHVRPRDPNAVWTEILVGGDHGWEDPGVLLIIGVIGKGADAVCHVLWECYQRQQPNAWWDQKAREIVSWYPQARWYLDPSRPDRIEDYRRCGARTHAAQNGIEAGVATIADLLSVRETNDSPPRRISRLYIDPSCKNLIAEMSQYRRKRDPRDPDRYLEAIDGRNDHAIDSLKYAVLTHFGAPAGGRNEANVDRRPR